MRIKIEDYEPEEPENEYAEDVENLMRAGEKKVGKIIVPADKVKRAKFKISRAANNLGLTASHKTLIVLNDGTIELSFTLGPKHKPRVKSKAIN